MAARKSAKRRGARPAKSNTKQSPAKPKSAPKKAAAKRKPAPKKAAAKRKPAPKKAAAKRKPAPKQAAAKRKPAPEAQGAAKPKGAAKKTAVKPKGAPKKTAVKPKGVAKKTAVKREPTPKAQTVARPRSAPHAALPAKRPALAERGVSAPDQQNPIQSTATPRVREGDVAPTFELHDQDGNVVSSATLAGAPYVIYFYPKDDTPGCTREACDFRDSIGRVAQGAARVVGVGPDSSDSHKRFAGKYALPFTLLSDPDKEAARAYGVWTMKKNYGREYMGIERSTFLVDGAGVVRKAWRGVRVDGHVDAVLASLAQI